MPKSTYRGSIPKPDNRGCVRPEIGADRFTIANIRTDSQGEMKRRRDAVAGLFDVQCQQTGEGRWVEPFLGFAKKLASGHRLRAGNFSSPRLRCRPAIHKQHA